ncbi:MAG: metallophosphoesterase family protein [bacterium]
MRIMFISDIHGNLEALNKSLEYKNELNIDKVIGLGDYIGYGVNPNECIDLIKNFECVRGNHDTAIFNKKELLTHNDMAYKMLKWTQKELTEDNINYLKALPSIIADKKYGYTAIHGSLIKPFDYIDYIYDAKKNFIIMELPLLFVGHTHEPKIWIGYKDFKNNKKFKFKINEIDEINDNKVFYINKDNFYIINVGSIGFSRDGNNKGCFAVYDSKDKTIEFYRVNYNRGLTIRKMIEAGVSKKIYERLISGN